MGEMKKKILLFHGCLPPYRIDLFNSFADDFDLQVILMAKPIKLRALGFDAKAMETQAKFHFEWHNRGLYFGNHLISMIYGKVIRCLHPDIVWCQELGVNTLCAIFLKRFFKYKIMLSVDDSPAMLSKYSILRRILRRFVYRRVNLILVVSRQVKSILKKEFESCNFFYMPIIQDEQKFTLKLGNAALIADENTMKYGLKDKVVFLFVGRMEQEKQPLFLLHAFMEANMADAVLVLVGNGSLSHTISDVIVSHHLQKKVIQTGKLQGNNLYAWYRLADYFILPSKYEPFGSVVNEALLSGCKVIVSDQVGASTLVNGVNGTIFPFQDESKLIYQMKAFAKIGKKQSTENLMDISSGKLYENLKKTVEFL
jgi:glycosyltransferase involved in cell wall biosynthesis